MMPRARARGLERSRWTNEDAGGDARDGDDADKVGVDVEAKDAFDGDSGRRTRGGGGARTAEGGRARRASDGDSGGVAVTVEPVEAEARVEKAAAETAAATENVEERKREGGGKRAVEVVMMMDRRVRRRCWR